MAKTPNPVPTTSLTLSINERTRRALEHLVKNSFFGNNAADAATQIILERLRHEEGKALLPSGWDEGKTSSGK